MPSFSWSTFMLGVAVALLAVIAGELAALDLLLSASRNGGCQNYAQPHEAKNGWKPTTEWVKR